MRAVLYAAVVAALGLGACGGAGATPSLAGSTRQATGGSPTARDLPLAPSVSDALVAAAASSYRLPASAFLGLASANQGFAAYYAYDYASSTYWAAASLVPNPKDKEAEVVVQDDGAYIIFHRAANGPWEVQDAGYSDSVRDCAAYHVNLPAAIAAAWHWTPGTCHPLAAPTATQAAPLAGVALARHDWFLGARASSAQEGEYWVRAATTLTGAAANTPADRRAAAQLRQLAGLPDAQETPAQQTESGADATALNAFFATNGLYGVNAPSATTTSFVATLQTEARIGTLSANEPQANGAIPGPLADATVGCPVLTSLTVGTVFGCTLSDGTAGSFILVGTLEAAHGTSYIASMLSEPVSRCADLDPATRAVVKKLGGVCR